MKTKEEKEVVDKYKTKNTSAKIALLGSFTALLILLFAVASVTAAEYQVHEGESIQAVINMANPGDTIIVHNGTYTENVVVNRSKITLRSANGSAVTIVQSNRTDMHVFNITDQNNVTLEGFTIRDASAALNTTMNDKGHSHAISALLLPPEYQRGSIRVTSEPSGAKIGLVTPDGPFVGPIFRTPYLFDKVSVGYSTITVYLEGYYDWSKKVQVQVDQTTYVHAQLKPKHKPTPPPPTTGAISVASTPSGATIYVDTYLGWSYKGKTPNTITGVSPDYYTIKLSLTGYQDWTKKIHVAAGETARIRATMSQATGSISVTSTPSDALMYLDDQYKGKTPHTITAVSPGYHIIKLTLADYLDWPKEVHVAAGETSCFDVKLTPILGSISVTSSPSDATIYLDDRYRGKTPHRVAEVSSGNHTLRLTLDGYQDWSTDLQVSVGETSDVAAMMIPSFTQAGIYMNNASNCVIKNNKILNITATGYSVGIAVYNSVGNKIQGGEIINCGQGLLIAFGSNNIIEENIIRDNTIAGAGVRIESSATNTGIHENCFIDNVPQAWDDGTANNWIGNYWSPPPGGQGNYIIPGAAGSEDKDPLDECPLKEQST